MRRSLFSEGLVIARDFAFQNGFGLSIKTASSNSPCLIFGRACYRKDISVWDLGDLFSEGLIYLFIYLFILLLLLLLLLFLFSIYLFIIIIIIIIITSET